MVRQDIAEYLIREGQLKIGELQHVSEIQTANGILRGQSVYAGEEGVYVVNIKRINSDTLGVYLSVIKCGIIVYDKLTGFVTPNYTYISLSKFFKELNIYYDFDEYI